MNRALSLSLKITLTVPLIVFIIQAVTRFTYGANQGCGGKVNTTTGLNSKQHFSK